MNSRYLMLGLIATACGGNAMAAGFGYMSNDVAAYNIVAAQHTIQARASLIPIRAYAPTRTNAPASDSDEYGEMIYYGEYGDDTGILPLVGHSGGDMTNAYVGMTWQHMDEDVKFNANHTMDSAMDLAMIEFGNNHALIIEQPLDMKFFGGYVGGNIKNNDMKINQDGGFVGAYAHQAIEDFDIGVIANLGLMMNDPATTPHTDEFNNLWAAIGVNASYNFMIDDDVVLRPGISGAYMWISGPNYVLDNGDNIDNKNFGVFELTPTVDLNAHLGHGWIVGAHGAYVMNFVNGGETFVNYTKISKLELDDYFEYGIKIEKYVGDFHLGVNAGRHDGGRAGWFGGATVRYLF